MRLFCRPSQDRAQVYPHIARLSAIAHANNAILMFHSKHKEWLGELADVYCDSREQLLARCDAVIALGGDGTIIHTAKLAAEAGRPILGINAGNLGFTAGLEASELDMVARLIVGDYTLQGRLMLNVAVFGDNDEQLFTCHAINEAVVSRGTLSKIVDLRVYHDDRLAMDFRADGLIVSTPTGSTGYSLSAGGPVIDPQIRCITLTPICPHSLRTRTIIFGSDAHLTVELDRRCKAPSEGGDVFLSVDGENSFALEPGYRVTISESAVTADFVIIKQQSFSEIMREKLYNR